MNIQTGDVLFVDSGTFIGNMIKKVSRFNFSHVALALDETHIVEITAFTKSKVITLDELEYETIVVKRPYQNMSSAEQQRIKENAELLLNRSYDYRSLVLLMLNYLFGIKTRPFSNTLKRVYCCEMVDYVYECAGIDLVPGKVNRVIGVDDLFHSKELFTVQTIKR